MGTPVQGGIVDGKFEFMSLPGPKIVRIQSVFNTGKRDPKNPAGFIMDTLVPARYDSDSTLKLVVEDKEHVKEKGNVFDYDLKSK
jgi:hypothetical protein